MPRIRSARSDISDADEGAAEREIELVKLQNRFRIMQGDRQAYTEESQNLIRKQRYEIDQLNNDREELLKEMRLAESRSNQSKDEANCDKLILLTDEKDETHRRIEEEKSQHAELDSKIREWERKIKKQQSNMGGALVSRHHTIQISKRMRTLENRLDNTVTKYNKTLTTNATLRDEIDSLRVERKRFDTIHKKLDKVLMQLRREIADLIESSTQSYEQREEAQSKMLQIKEKADKDLLQHNQEMKELIRIIDHDRRLKEFMSHKTSEREEDSQLTAWKAKKSKEADERRAAAEDSVETYEAAFARMRELTGEHELERLVENFIEKEDRNFALFNYVNEQNNAIEVHSEQIQELKDQIDTFNAQSMQLEQVRQGILSDLDNDRQESASVANKCEEKLTSVKKILDQLTVGIDSLFKKIGCDRSSLEGLLGASEQVNQGNMIQYLGLVEQRTNELLGVQNYVILHDANDSGFESRSGGGGPPVPTTLLGEGPGAPVQHPTLMPPSLADDFESGDGDDDDDATIRPFSREALQSKVIKTVIRKEVEAKKDPYLHFTSGPSKTKLKGK